MDSMVVHRAARLYGVVGRMHRISSGYIPPEGLPRRPEWDSIGSCFNPSSLTADDGTPISDRWAEKLLLIGELPKDKDSYGLIHADLHCANLCVETGSGLVKFIDFDDSCYGWYAMDIAMSLFDAVVLYGEADGGGFPKMFLGNYLSGYISETPLQPFWVEQLPLFLKLLEIGVYSQVERAYRSGTDDQWIRRFMPGRLERIVENVPFVDLRFPEVAASMGNSWSRGHIAAG